MSDQDKAVLAHLADVNKSHITLIEALLANATAIRQLIQTYHPAPEPNRPERCLKLQRQV